MRIEELHQIAELSTPEKILLLEDLWESISSNDSDVPVPQSHIDELTRRAERHAAHPDDLLTLEELQARIAKRT